MKNAVVNTHSFPIERYHGLATKEIYREWMAEQLAMQGIRLVYSQKLGCRIPDAPCTIYKTPDGRILVQQEDTAT